MRNNLQVVDLGNTGLELENVDLMESDNEDEVFKIRRRKGTPSRTGEIASRLSRFYSDVKKHTRICLDPEQPGQEKRLEFLHSISR